MKGKLKKAAESAGEAFVLTFTKKWVQRLMWFSFFTIPIPYVLGAVYLFLLASSNLVIDAEILQYVAQIIATLETLSEKVCEVILGAFIVYMAKAFWETYAEKKNELEEKKFDTPEEQKEP